MREVHYEWLPVCSGVPNRRAMGPLLSLIYINNLMDGKSFNGKLHVDGAKIYRWVKDERDCSSLHRESERLQKWS